MAQHTFAPAEVPLFPPSPAVMPGTVGAVVADLSNKIEWHEAQRTDEGYRYAGVLHEQLLTNLDTFSTDLGALSDDKRATLSPYVTSILAEYMPSDDIYQQDVVKQLQHMTATEQVAFLRRHVAVVERQGADMENFLGREKQSFAHELQNAGKWVSPAAADAAADALVTPVELGDWWDTQLNNAEGHHRYGRTPVTVSQGIGATREERNRDFMHKTPETLKHELFHKEFGGYLPNDMSWADEPLAEHGALALEYGEWGVFHPDERQHTTPQYREARILMAEVMDGLDPGLLTRAATSRDRNSQEWAALRQAVDAKYGSSGMCARIAKAIRVYRELAADMPGATQLYDYEIEEAIARVVAGDLRNMLPPKKPQALVGAAAVGAAAGSTS